MINNNNNITSSHSVESLVDINYVHEPLQDIDDSLILNYITSLKNEREQLEERIKIINSKLHQIYQCVKIDI